MWIEVTADRDDLLLRYAEILRLMDHRNRYLSIEQSMAGSRSSIARGRIELFYYREPGYEVVLRIQREARLGRYLVCPGFIGSVGPGTVLDIVVEKSQEYMATHELDALYGIRPEQVDYAPLALLYELMEHDPRIRVVTEGQTSDSTVLKLEMAPVPP